MDIDTKIRSIETEKTSTRVGSRDYVQSPRKKEDGLDFEVNVYGNSRTREYGYQTVFRENRDDGVYVKIVATGPEEKSRTHDWSKIE